MLDSANEETDETEIAKLLSDSGFGKEMEVNSGDEEDCIIL